MDSSQLNSIATSGKSAATTVATALSSPRAVAKPKDATAPTSGSTSAASNSSDITSDDFLTLLVSELKNQDPTQPTDPNAYITQLAQVNSLQQLISINQGIGTLDGAISTPPTSTGSSGSDSNANAVSAVANANMVTGNNAIWGGSTTS
jgi:flagellar basal-body rod modification protein FlgD